MAVTDKDARSDRLGAALRENLRRRKAQQRGRDQAGGDPGHEPRRNRDGDQGRNDGRQGG